MYKPLLFKKEKETGKISYPVDSKVNKYRLWNLEQEEKKF